MVQWLAAWVVAACLGLVPAAGTEVDMAQWFSTGCYCMSWGGPARRVSAALMPDAAVFAQVSCNVSGCAALTGNRLMVGGCGTCVAANIV
ncbi:hypothetical protein COO60DRAFT_477911 [Scenedesmus sp. NREL 46B-D3]|nr:hypothetical protein COO60DRAFT_477911 [Scenedesmus sp. NREL 46B-D3]